MGTIRRTGEAERAEAFAGGTGGALLQAMRLEQWLKNVLVFLPMLAAHQFFSGDSWAAAGLCFVLFSLGASGQYLVNDLADVRWDREDPRKRLRPVAAGRLGRGAAGTAAAVLMGASVGMAWLLPAGAAAVLLGYHALALAYTFALKRAAILDVIVLAVLYGLRVFAGGAAVGIWPSPWLIAFTLFLFLSLALLKRVVELPHEGEPVQGRAVQAGDRLFLIVLGVNAGLMSVVVLALYIQAPMVKELYRRPEALWLLALALAYWVARTWLRAVRGEMARGLWMALATDRGSYATFGVALLICYFAI